MSTKIKFNLKRALRGDVFDTETMSTLEVPNV